MKRTCQSLLAALLASLCCASAVLALTPDELKRIREPPIILDRAGKPELAVTFQHARHARVKCRTCHHVKAREAGRYVSCSDREACHNLMSTKDRTSIHSYFLALHSRATSRSCFGCHRRSPETRDDGCRSCHKRRTKLTRE